MRSTTWRDISISSLSDTPLTKFRWHHRRACPTELAGASSIRELYGQAVAVISIFPAGWSLTTLHERTIAGAGHGL
jgi:hypothetical protein